MKENMLSKRQKLESDREHNRFNRDVTNVQGQKRRFVFTFVILTFIPRRFAMACMIIAGNNKFQSGILCPNTSRRANRSAVMTPQSS